MKQRLDNLLIQKGFFTSKSIAQQHILAGNVLINDRVVTKAGMPIKADSKIRIKQISRYVSRGGYKLEKALKTFNIDLANLNVLDVGASTGGFTDCLLQHNASFVYALDVGFNQLAYKLRVCNKVCVLDKVNIRYVNKNMFSKKLQLATIDLSFISLTIVLKHVFNVLDHNKTIIALIKPQFEVGRNIKNFKGIVKDSNMQLRAIENVLESARKTNLYLHNITFSPFKGKKGNIEFLALFKDYKTLLPDYCSLIKEANYKLNLNID